MTCINISDLPCPVYRNGYNNQIVDSIQYLPDKIRKEVRLLFKQYYITTIEHIGQYESFNEYGEIYSTIVDTSCDKKMVIPQKYDLKIEYRNTETEEDFFRLYLTHEN